MERIAITPTRDTVIGHDRSLGLLHAALANGRLAHAYLFTGPDGVGKRTVARIFARDLLGGDGPLGTHPDLVEVSRSVDAKTGVLNSGIRIEQAREVRGRVSRGAFMNGWTVCIIDDAHLLTVDAANALLKTLEEPHDRVVFMLLATSADLVMATIRSRCQHIAFSRVPEHEIADALSADGTPEADAALLARIADGCPGRAFALAADPDAFASLRAVRDAVIELPGLDIASRWRTVERLLPAKMPFNEAGKRAGNVLDLAAEVFRDAMLEGYGRGDEVVHIDARDRTARMLGGDPMRAARALEGVRRVRRELRENVNPRTALQRFVATL